MIWDIVLFQGATPLGPTFQNVLFHVAAEASGIELEIVPNLNLGMVVKIVLTLVQQWRQWSVNLNLVLFQGVTPLGLTFQNVLSHVAVGVNSIELEIAPNLNLDMEVKIVLTLDQQWRQLSVVRTLVLFLGVTPLGLTFQNVLSHVAAEASGIELEIVPNLNLSMEVKIVLTLVQQWRRLNVVRTHVLSQGAIPLGPTFQNVLSHVAVGVNSIELEIVPNLNLDMEVKIVLTLVQQWRQWSVNLNLVLFQGATPLGPTFQNVLSHVAVGARGIELEIAPNLYLSTEVKIVLKLVQQWRQLSVVRTLVLFQGATPLGLTFQNVLSHVAVGVHGIELEIVPNLYLSMVVKIVLTLVQLYRQWSVNLFHALFQGVTPLGLTFQNVLSHVAVGVRGIELEIVPNLYLSMEVKIVLTLVQQWRQLSVVRTRVLFQGATPLGLTFLNVLSHVAVGARGIELEIVPNLYLSMEVKIVLKLVQQWRQLSVVRTRVLFQGATPLGLTFQNVLSHVAVGVRGIELEIAPNLNLNMEVKIVLTLVQQWRQLSVVRTRVLFQGATPLGLTFQNVLPHVAAGVHGIELEIAPIPNLNMVDRIAQELAHL